MDFKLLSDILAKHANHTPSEGASSLLSYDELESILRSVGPELSKAIMALAKKGLIIPREQLRAVLGKSVKSSRKLQAKVPEAVNKLEKLQSKIEESKKETVKTSQGSPSPAPAGHTAPSPAVHDTDRQVGVISSSTLEAAQEEANITHKPVTVVGSSYTGPLGSLLDGLSAAVGNPTEAASLRESIMDQVAEQQPESHASADRDSDSSYEEHSHAASESHGGSYGGGGGGGYSGGGGGGGSTPDPLQAPSVGEPSSPLGNPPAETGDGANGTPQLGAGVTVGNTGDHSGQPNHALSTDPLASAQSADPHAGSHGVTPGLQPPVAGHSGTTHHNPGNKTADPTKQNPNPTLGEGLGDPLNDPTNSDQAEQHDHGPHDLEHQHDLGHHDSHDHNQHDLGHQHSHDSHDHEHHNQHQLHGEDNSATSEPDNLNPPVQLSNVAHHYIIDGHHVDTTNNAGLDHLLYALSQSKNHGDLHSAYSSLGLELPDNNSMLGQTVDPANLQAGDLLGFENAQGVFLGNNLVFIDGKVETVDVAIQSHSGFTGFFQPAPTPQETQGNTPSL